MPDYSKYMPAMGDTHVAGNDYASDSSMGFKSEVAHVLESYAARNVSIPAMMEQALFNDTAREEFLDNVMESIVASHLHR